jgi:hypothetical protein
MRYGASFWGGCILMRRGIALFGLMVVTVALLLAGCGGGGDDGPESWSGNGTLTWGDELGGEPVDTLTFTATRTGDVTVYMDARGTSNPVEDPYIGVWVGTRDDWDDGFIASDDDSGTGLNAYCVFRATKGLKYTVGFNDWEGGTGDYSYGVYEEGARTMQVRPAADEAGRDKDLTKAGPFARRGLK